jgi:hypothetical protein
VWRAAAQAALLLPRTTRSAARLPLPEATTESSSDGHETRVGDKRAAPAFGTGLLLLVASASVWHSGAAEDLRAALLPKVAVHEPGVLQRLVDRRPPPLPDERDDHPRRCEQRTAEQDRRSPQPRQERPAGDQRPDQ